LEELHYRNGSETFTVSHRRALSHNMPIKHFHNTYEIFYLLSGKREFFIKDRTMVVHEGDIVIIAPNILHRTTNTETPQHERLIVNIHEKHLAIADGSAADLLQQLLELEYVVIRSSPEERLDAEALARRIVHELRERRPGFETYMQTLTLQLLIHCCRNWNRTDAAALEFPSPMHERMSEVVQYINSHYPEELSLHRLAETFYVSPYYLSRSFKEATGFTIVEYINSVRIKEAKKLLMRSSMKVQSIAKKVGFGSVTQFGRVFKQVTGHPPLFYRKGK